MSHTQGSLHFIFDVVDYPGHWSCNCPNVVNFETDIQFFCFGGIIISLLLYKAVDVGVVDFEDKCVLGQELKINPDFCDGKQAAESDCKWEDKVFWMSLLCSDDMFAYLELGKLRVRVKNGWHADVLTLSQETEPGTFLWSSHLHCDSCSS